MQVSQVNLFELGPTWLGPVQISSLDLFALSQHHSHIQCKLDQLVRVYSVWLYINLRMCTPSLWLYIKGDNVAVAWANVAPGHPQLQEIYLTLAITDLPQRKWLID